MNPLEMTSHMWDVYTKNIDYFLGIVTVRLARKLTVEYAGIKLCEFNRFSDESSLIHHIRKDVEKKGGRVRVIWMGR